MKILSLRPHTFMTTPEHPRHHAWLTSFSPRQRHDLIEEDCAARRAAFTIIIGAISSGLLMLLIALVVMA